MSADTMAASSIPGAALELNGLHSPPDSNMKDASDSELSDLEDEHIQPPEQPAFALTAEAEDIGEIEPAYYSDDGVPVFVPTMEQFKDFTIFMNKINKYGMRSGIVKVIPPDEWKAVQPRLDEAVKTIKVKEPIKQDIMGTGGTYRQANMIHQRSYNLPQWRGLCDQSDHQPPAKRGERRANQDKPTRSMPKTKSSGTTSSTTSNKRGRGRPMKGKARGATVDTEDGAATPDRLPTPISPSMRPEEDSQLIKLEEDEEDEKDETPEKPRLGSRQAKPSGMVSVSSRRKNNRREAAAKVDEAAFKDFEYELEGETYSDERCQELERAYWKTLTYAPPLYGADMPGTLFDERTTTWNLGKLDNILDVMGAKIPGVNTAYLYLGMWKATFAWHLEDVDLYSINYLHFGAPKQWYSIAQGDARRFEAAMKSIWPTDAKACDQFLRHKTFLISPAHLLQNFNIKVNKIVAHPGEFVITFPYGYHSGYNLGYNCAEAVNFGLESWLEYGRVAKKCDCAQAQDSVWIDVRDLERKLSGEETEYEETDDEEDEEEDDNDNVMNLPTPPESGGDAKIKAPKAKRKRPLGDKGTQVNTKRIRIRVKIPAKEPCVLCPNDIPSEALLPTEDGQKAHRICAQYIPETSIDEETVMDIKYIAKGRLDLKCNYCRSKKGACFQCSAKKCTRAYHATCAAAAGVFVEQGEIPVFGEDGTEYKEWGIEFSCRFHRSKRDKKLDSDALSDSERLRKAGSELKVGEVCQAQYYKGDIFAGVVVENCKGEEMVLLDIHPRGDRVEVEYKWLLIADPADYRLPKPSANAIALPKSRKDKESLNTSKRQADDIPRADDPFVEGHTWSEFKNENIPRNLAQVKIDLTKENQVWHYLGKTSTEARAQFTEDSTKQRNNPKGNFLDTIPKHVVSVPRQSYAASYPSTSRPQVTSTSKAPYRPILPPGPSSTISARPEKPYVYKPRNTEESYRVDKKAYDSQQSFLQRSAAPPLSFGTDPRYTTTNSSTPQNAISTTPSNSYSGYPAIRAKSPLPPNQLAHSALYRPAYVAPAPVPAPAPAQPVNPFGNRPRPQNARQSVFSKYPYLQKEHNTSSSDYKSPYRPGGGFMNGYQGSLQKHLQQTMFQNRSSGGTSLSNPPISAQNNTRTSYSGSTGNQPTSYYGTSYSASHSKYGVSRLAQYQTPSKPGAVTLPPVTWERKKDNTQLHPAIRQEYHKSLLQNVYPNMTAQPRSSVLQPPPLYERPPYQPPSYMTPSYSTPQRNYNTPQANSVLQPNYNYNHAQQSLSASHPQQYGRSMPAQPVPAQSQPQQAFQAPQPQQHQNSPQTYHSPQLPQHQLAQYFQTPPPLQQQQSVNQRPAIQQPPMIQSPVVQQIPEAPGPQSTPQPRPTKETRIIPPPRRFSISNPATVTQQSQRASVQHPQPQISQAPYQPSQLAEEQENKQLYPYQQDFQKPEVYGQSFQHQPQYQLLQQPQILTPSKFELADVPPDSCSIVEKMMSDLRKVQADTPR